MADAETRSLWERVAVAGAGEAYAASYAARFRALSSAQGDSVHGEASFVASLLPAPARVLDAGCGTGRVAMRLASLGYDVVGVDVDASMLAEARSNAPSMTWIQADLSSMTVAGFFDLVLIAGNVVPLLEPGTLSDTAIALATHLEPGGLLVAGFGLDAAHLPAGCPVMPVVDWAAALAGAHLDPVSRHAGWDGAGYDPAGGYLVSVDRRSR